MNPSALRENKATTWVLGIIMALVFVFAMKILMDGRYAG